MLTAGQNRYDIEQAYYSKKLPAIGNSKSLTRERLDRFFSIQHKIIYTSKGSFFTLARKNRLNRSRVMNFESGALYKKNGAAKIFHDLIRKMHIRGKKMKFFINEAKKLKIFP
jgi:hypothetical protein